MEYKTRYPDLGPDPFSVEGKALARTGLWMCVGFVGASMLAIGMIAVWTGDARPGYALALAAAGAVLAYYGSRRSLQDMERIDPEANPIVARRGAAGARMAEPVADGHPSTARSVASNIPLLPFGS